MRTVNIAELKNRLSTYLNFAKAGEEVIIRDRNKPVARLVPYVAADASEEELELVAKGLMRLPRKAWDIAALRKMPQTRDIGNQGTQAVIEERNEGW